MSFSSSCKWAALGALGVVLYSWPSDASAQNASTAFIAPEHLPAPGWRSSPESLEGLRVYLEIRRLNVNGDRSEICAVFRNTGSNAWEGGYRITNRDDRSTFATVNVPGNDERARCELLPRARMYYVVLNRYGD